MIATAALGQLADLIGGVTFKPEDVLEVGDHDSLVCFRTKNVQGDLDQRDLIAVPRRVARRAELLLRAGDLLVSSANSWNLVGKCCWVPSLNYEAVPGGFISLLRPRPAVVVPRYLYHWLAAAKTQAAVRLCARQTTNISNLDRNRFLALRVPLPTVEDQRHIAEILDRADDIQRKRRECVRLVDELLRATFLEMFGDPVVNPRQWPMVALDEFTTVVTGNTPSRDRLEWYGNDIEWIKSDNLGSASFYAGTASEGLSTLGKRVARVAPAGSILMTCIAGSPESIGKIAIADREVAFNQQINALIPNEFSDTAFVFGLFRVAKKQVQALSSGAMKGMVTKGNLAKLQLPLPPQTERARFGRAFEVMDRARKKSSDALLDAEALFASLQERAFSGALTEGTHA